METAVWVALITGVPTALGLIGGAMAWAINLITAQSRDTIATLRDERDYWRSEAQACREQARTPRDGVG